MAKIPKASFRVYAVIFGIFIFGIGLIAHGWFSWTEGSVLIHVKNGRSYVATPNSSTATSYYLVTLGSFVFGVLANFVAMRLIWSVFFAPTHERAKFIEALLQPIKSNRPPIPDWLFWGVVAAIVLMIVSAAVTFH